MRLILSLLLSLSCSVAFAQFESDVLGANFEHITIKQPDAYDGEVVTTVTRHRPIEGVKRGVLYVHGYNDYFFQAEMAEQFVAEGWQFYAVDLRRYGRSLREWQTPFDLRSVDEYFADIDVALDLMESEGVEQIILMGHSTGGLTTSLYCDNNRSDLRVDALILNSPFFDMNLESWFMEEMAVPVISGLGGIFRNWRVIGGSDSVGGYARSICNKYDGEWEIDTQVKRPEALPITAGWLRAIHRGQRKLQKGLDVPCPVLVLYSDNSVYGKYSSAYKRGDSVLDVVDIKEYASAVGSNVTEIEVEGGMHDLVLSAADVRYPLYKTIFKWINSEF